MSSTPDTPDDPTEVLPQEGTVAFRPPSPAADDPAADRTGTWEVEPQGPEATAKVTPAPPPATAPGGNDPDPVAAETRVWEAEREAAGATADFTPGMEGPGPITAGRGAAPGTQPRRP